MKLDETIELIKECTQRMDALYSNVVFDEWAIISFREKQGRVMAYHGLRKETFSKNFEADLEGLKSALLTVKHETGDFEFTRHGSGTRFDAFLVLGEELYLICNNTTQSIQEITKDSRWIAAQIPFAELTDKFRENPLV